MIKYFTFLLLVFYCRQIYSQTLIPKEFKKVVAFIFVENDSGNIVPNGTGFYVGVMKTEATGTGYLVTAKHVLRKENGSFFDKIFLRVVNKVDSSLVSIPIKLDFNSKNKNVFFHSDTTVDIAVVSNIPSQKIYDYTVLPSSFLTTKNDFDSLNITEGDEVFFTGMFSQYLGTKANYPITRFGRVSLVTNEKVFWNGEYRNLYLLETTTYWGNSGSPVYFALQRKPKQIPNAIITGRETVIKLAGIMSGFFGQNVPGGFVQTNLRPYQLVNFGISAVTPAYFLWDILFSQEVQKKRGF